MLVIAQQLLAVALRGGGWCKADWNHSVFVSYGSLPLAGASQTICLLVPRWFPENFMVISSVGNEIWARVHTSGSSNTQYQVHGEKYISRTRFFPDMRFSQDDSRHFVLSISAIKSAYSMVRFSAKCQKPHFLAHICNFWMIQNFWPKKGSVSFFLLSISNFMQKIRMISWPVFKKKWWLTD